MAHTHYVESPSLAILSHTMRYSIALLALLPALVAGHPFERRNTASTAVGEEELSTVPVASYGDTTSSYAGVTSSNPAYTTSSYAGVTSSNPAYSSAPTSYASSNGQYASSSGGAALCTMSPSCGALTGSGVFPAHSHLGSESG